MYKIIGADGREYGPVTADQLRQWIRDGRANAQTKAQAEGATDWKTLAELPEFADALGSARPTTPPVVNAVDAEALAAQILARDYRIEIGRCISRGWELVKNDFWMFVGASFIGGLIASGAGIGPLGLIIGGPMMGGLYALYLKKIRGQPATFGDAFIGFTAAFVPLMLTKIVATLLTVLGFVLCILPGIYLLVAWVFAVPLVMDKRIDFWQAMELSRKVVSKHWWVMFGFLIVCALVMLLGVLVCCVGVLVATPVIQAALMYAYEDIFGVKPASPVV
jgi:hypothetical protein